MFLTNTFVIRLFEMNCLNSSHSSDNHDILYGISHKLFNCIKKFTS